MNGLEDELKALRLKIAKEENIPAYCVFDNKTVDELIKFLPFNLDELSGIKGFGQKRIEKYGDRIIDLIKNYSNKNNLEKSPVEIKTQKEEIKIDIENTILNCIKKFNGGFGKSGMVKILKGADIKTKSYYSQMYYETAIQSEFYGALKDLSKKSIELALDKLIFENKILKTGGLKPMLKISNIDYTKIKPKKLTATEDIVINPIKIDIQNKERDFHEKFLKTMGYESFRDNQWAVIKELLNNKKVLLIEKTGFGKSLCYQYLSELFYKENKGVTIVFSPLLSLMRDQVNSLKEKGIKADCIIAEHTLEENISILKQASKGEISILYISPERLENQIWLNFLTKIRLSMVVIDEAHCISQWGHDFRPSYRRILNLITSLPENFPVLAVSATATTKITEDIKIQLGDNLKIIKGSLYRKNLNLNSIYCKNIDEKLYWILRIIKNLDGSGLIYCTRKIDTVLVSKWLNYNSISSCYYHAGLDREDRTRIEKEFFENKYKAIASTNALGMGVDKKDIRFIIHFSLTENLMNYYQEIGRAGRDNNKSWVILLYNSKDKDLIKFFIDHARPEFKKYKFAIKKLMKKPYTVSTLALELGLEDSQADTLLNDLLDENIVFKEQKTYSYNPEAKELDEDYFIFQEQQKLIELDKMAQYATTKTCRMKYLCNYFEDDIPACGVCDNCKKYNFKIKDFNQTENKLNAFFKKEKDLNIKR